MTSSAMPPEGATRQEIDDAIEAILKDATREEKVGMMSGRGFLAAYKEDGGIWGARPYRAGGGIERLGLEPLYFTDGPRGVARGNSTCFPCSMARGATFDADLEYRIGEIMGIEARAQGCTLSGAVCMNLLRHPAWGRAQETYGEDSWHLGVMGAALGRGIQAHNVVATIKHFALNSMENARFTVDVRIAERTLHEVYLPHFKHALDAGVASVMTAYNKMNGEHCGQNRTLLTDILRTEWRFEGFVHSDWILGVYHPYGAAAGLDVENPDPIVFGAKLIEGLEAGTIEPQVVDDACRRILRTQMRFAAEQDPLVNYGMEMVASPEHRAVALEAAEKSAVLLENRDVLPFDRTRVGRIALLGRLAVIANTGDNGSSRVRPPQVVTVLEGLTACLGAEAILLGDENDLKGASAAAQAADAVVVVAGYTADDEGEFLPGDIGLDESVSDRIPDEYKTGRQRPTSRGGDRTNLELPADQIALIGAAAASGRPVVVVLVSGSAVLVEAWREKTGAILQTFYAGMEGGTALAKLLFGETTPSGRLPFTVARSAEDYPFFDRDAKRIEFGYWHGYAKLDREGVVPRYAFGHGLSYATFSYRALSARRNGNVIDVSVAVRNDGASPADEVVQCYVGVPGRVTDRPIKTLRDFRRVRLAPGETRIVHMSVAIHTLRWRDPATHEWRLEHGDHHILVGGSSAALIERKVTL